MMLTRGALYFLILVWYRCSSRLRPENQWQSLRLYAGCCRLDYMLSLQKVRSCFASLMRPVCSWSDRRAFGNSRAPGS